MTRSRTIVSAVLLGVALAGLSACGGNGDGGATNAAPPTTTTTAHATGAEAQRYDRRMQALGNKLSTYFTHVGQADVSAKQAKIVANLREIQRRLRAAAGQLSAMHTPPDVAADHRKLIAAVREYADELNQVITQVKAGHRTALFGITQLQGVKAMGRATEAIARDGYDITGTGAPSG